MMQPMQGAGRQTKRDRREESAFRDQHFCHFDMVKYCQDFDAVRVMYFQGHSTRQIKAATGFDHHFVKSTILKIQHSPKEE